MRIDALTSSVRRSHASVLGVTADMNFLMKDKPHCAFN